MDFFKILEDIKTSLLFVGWDVMFYIISIMDYFLSAQEMQIILFNQSEGPCIFVVY